MDRSLVVLAVVALVVLAAAAVASRRRRSAAAGPPARLDPAEFGLDGLGGPRVVVFSSPYCVACERWERRLHEAGVPWAKVNVAERAELARRYGVRATPLVLAVELPGGRVVEAYAGDPDPDDVARLARIAAA